MSDFYVPDQEYIDAVSKLRRENTKGTDMPPYKIYQVLVEGEQVYLGRNKRKAMDEAFYHKRSGIRVIVYKFTDQGDKILLDCLW